LELRVKQRTGSLRQLSSRLHHVQDDERRKIARELHDSVGQYLTSIKLNLAQVNQPELEMKAKAALSESVELLDRCFAEIRTISHLLYPPVLDESGLASAATWYVEGFGKRSSIQTDLQISPRLERLPQAVEMTLFRALQESLTNVHRHSGSPKVDIRIELENGQIDLVVREYGRGIAPEKLQHLHTAGADLGIGLTGMRERVNELGGSLQVLSENPGTSVRISVPIGQDRAKAAQRVRVKPPDENGSARNRRALLSQIRWSCSCQ
jgi:two-component system, NarL family, sensor kinase